LLPESFIQSLEGLPGFDKEAFIAVHEQGKTFTSIRVNSAKKVDPANHSFLLQSTEIPWCPEGRYLAQRPSFVTDPLWHAGGYYVQEASSMLLHYVLTQIVPNPGQEKVLDLCAAPGGKSTLLANYFPKGLLVANETIKSRNHILVENTTKWGAENIVVTQNDPAHFKALPNFFDVLVIDAPCSGSGLFRKDPSAINEWSTDHVQHCSVRQARILEDSIPTLKAGGYLIYATCSYSSLEDEGIMDYIASLPGMKNVTFDMPAEWGVQDCFSEQAHAKGFKCFPDKVKGEGFFITVFKKEEDSSFNYPNDDFKFTIPTKSDLQILNSFFELPPDSFYLTHQSEVIAIPLIFKDSISTLLSQLYVKKTGIAMGAIKGKDFIPAHALAMSQWKTLPYDRQEVDLETALNYLRRADFTLPAGKGWKLLTYLNLPLGWVKQLPNRSNNYYPNEWRILNY
jgi:16S rRNA C967 or C1407 C5-methylase (RsmB/RsmF family)/NOL1/NOP2/fmu family ribosome biogenesis protein